MDQGVAVRGHQPPTLPLTGNRSYASSPSVPSIRLVDPDDPQLDANPEPAGRGLSCTHALMRFITVQLMQRVILFAEDPTVTRAAILVRRIGVGGGEALAPICREHKSDYDVGEHDLSCPC